MATLVKKEILNPSKLSKQQQYELKVARWKARTDIGWLCRNILGYKDVSDKNGGPWRAVHQPVIDILQKFPTPDETQFWENDQIIAGTWKYTPILPILELPGKRRRLILDPRGYLKTTINSIAHTIQWIINYPDIAVLIFMGQDKKASDVLSEIKGHFQYNDRFRQLFPEHCPARSVGDWGTQDRFTTEARDKSRVRKEPTVMTGAIEKGAAGYHVEVIKFSDIVDENNISGNGLENVLNKFDVSLNLLRGSRYWIDVEGTRYHHGDTYGKILEREEARKPEKREYLIHIRSVFKRDIPDGETFTLSDMKYPFKLDENGRRIPWIPEIWNLDDLESEEENNPWIFSCTPAGSPILMSDWSEKAIEDIKIGDEIIGFSNTDSRNYLIKSKVIEIGNHIQNLVKITTDKGSVLYSTDDHEWYSGKKTKGRNGYMVPKIGRTLVRVYDRPEKIKQEDLPDWYWLCGILDGEGHFAKKQGQITITQSENVNPHVYAKIAQVLKKFNIDAHIYKRSSYKNHKNSTMWSLRGGRSLKIKFLHLGNLAKKNQIINALWASNTKVGKGRGAWEKIVSIEYVGKQRVYWLQTTSGNYINQGFASSNCQKLNFPGNQAGYVTFPVNDRFPVRISREDFQNNVRIAYKEISVDLASTDNKRSNYTAIVVGAVDHYGRLYIEEVIHGRFLPNVIAEKIFQTALKHYRHLRSIKLEESEFQRGFMPTLMRILDTQYRPKGINFTFDLIKRGNRTSKNDRIQRALQPWYQKAELRFLMDIEPNAWRRLIKELEEFPSGTTDDILDALADFLANKEYFGREQPRAFANIPRDRQGNIDPDFQADMFLRVQREKFDKWLQIEAPESIDYNFGPQQRKTDEWYEKFGIY